uniref:Uncharacterized protein n=1 Tax=Lepeophtheirus salmonis TaxID=72036 RepID=A0A0K2UF74_LEPSM
MTEENPPKRVGEQSLHIIPLGTLLPLKLKASTKSSKGAVRRNNSLMDHFQGLIGPVLTLEWTE